MTNQDQEKRLKKFSRAWFLLPWVYLLRGRQYVFGIITFIIYRLSSYLITNLPIILIIFFIVNFIVWIKGRKLVFEKNKKPFKEFKINYNKFSRTVIIIFISFFWIIIIWGLATLISFSIHNNLL